MALLRITKEEGHYTIKRVDRLPKRGNYNILYAMKTKTLNKFYRYLQDGEYEEIYLGAVSIKNTSDLVNDGSDGSSTYVENNELSDVAISGDYNDLINTPSLGIQSVVAGTNVSVNNADPLNPIVNSTLVIPTLTSSFTNDGSDGNSVYVEADELATVATTGDYDDLINTPSPGIQSVVAGTNVDVNNSDPLNPIVSSTLTIPTLTSSFTNDGSDGNSVYVEADELATVATTGDYDDLINTPSPGIESVVAGTNVTVDNTDPLNPIVSASGGGGGGGIESVVAGTNVSVDDSDPANPEVSADGTTLFYNASTRSLGSSTGNDVTLPIAGDGAWGVAQGKDISPSITSFQSGLSYSSESVRVKGLTGVGAIVVAHGTITGITGTSAISFGLQINLDSAFNPIFPGLGAGNKALGVVRLFGVDGDYRQPAARIVGSNQIQIIAEDASSLGNNYNWANATFTNATIEFTLIT